MAGALTRAGAGLATSVAGSDSGAPGVGSSSTDPAGGDGATGGGGEEVQPTTTTAVTAIRTEYLSS
ncbi:MAG: hypothetical protein ACOH2Q_25265 [Rhodococcus sp. (in: high G+C Gram-positive bacteria)]